MEAFRIEREATFANGIKDFLPVGLTGLMLAGMLAALASTIDTHLNWGASYLTNDLYKRFLNEKILNREAQSHELVWVARLSNLIILFGALVVMVNLTSIQSAWQISLLFGSGLGVVLIARWLWSRINVWSEFSAGAVSMIMAPVLLFSFPEMNEGLRLLLMLAISTGVMLFVTMITPREPEELLRNFYDQVRPPGFWMQYADKSLHESESPHRRLVKGTLAIAACACSVFFLLVGGGKLILSSSASAVIFPSILIAAGILLIPVWWKLGITGTPSE